MATTGIASVDGRQSCRHTDGAPVGAVAARTAMTVRTARRRRRSRDRQVERTAAGPSGQASPQGGLVAATPVGLDDIGITLRHDDAIRAAEAAYRARRAWLFNRPAAG